MKLLVYITCLGLLSGTAMAGPSSSGGGFAVVCRGSDQKIVTAETLDLFEARTTYGFELMPSSGNLEDDYFAAVANTYKLQGYSQKVDKNECMRSVSSFMKIARFTKPGEALPATADLGQHAPPPSGCAIEQAAVFDDLRQSVHIDSEIWSSLPSQSQAALVEHELAYSYARKLDENNSESSRSFVAHVFSANGPIGANAGAPKNARLEFSYPLSQAPDQPQRLSSFYVYDSGGSTIMQFTSLAGMPLVAKSSALLPNMKFIVKESYNGLRWVSIVDDPGANIDVRVPLSTPIKKNLEIRVRYVHGQEARLDIYSNGNLLNEQVLGALDTVSPVKPKPGVKIDYPALVSKAKLKYLLELQTTVTNQNQKTTTQIATVCSSDTSEVGVYKIGDKQNALPEWINNCSALLGGAPQKIEVLAIVGTLSLSNRPEEKVFQIHLRMRTSPVNVEVVSNEIRTTDLKLSSGTLKFDGPMQSFVTDNGRKVTQNLRIVASFQE